jgi:hypothetical protein
VRERLRGGYADSEASLSTCPTRKFRERLSNPSLGARCCRANQVYYCTTNRSGGWKAAPTKGVEFLKAQHKPGDSSAYDIAEYYAALGDKDQAFRWLEVAYDEHDNGLLALRTYASLDAIRSDPRVAEWVRKVGLPQ